MDVSALRNSLEQRYLSDLPSDDDVIDADQLIKERDVEGMSMLIAWIGEHGTRWQLTAMASLPWAEGIDLKGRNDVIEPIQKVLVDKEVQVSHVRAATALGELSVWPDEALVYAMQHDDSEVVRGVAFKAALILSGVPYGIARGYAAQVENGQLKATPKEVERLAKKYKVGI